MQRQRHRLRLKPTRRYHLDRRADQLAAMAAGPPDLLIDSKALAVWLGMSLQWVEIARSRGYGPPFVRLGPQRVRYRVDAVRAWLEERSQRVTL